MHRLLLSIFLICCCVPFAAAQEDDSPSVEFFGGFSVLKTKYRAELPNPPMPVVVAFDGDQKLNGFNVAATGYLTRRFGITGDFSGHFTSESVPDPLGGNITTKVRVYNFLGGPQVKFRGASRVSPFVRALAGVANTRSTINVPSINVSDTASSTDFVLAIGGGLDVQVSDHVDLRLFQVDYNPIFLRSNNELGFGNSRADNVRFSFGVVFK